MSIEMIGGVYCPLSPQDPVQRLHVLIKETQSRLVLVHSLTREKLSIDGGMVDIDEVLNTNRLVMNDIDIERLSEVEIGRENIAYVIFTSGSTGIPKAVRVSHIYCRFVFLKLSII
jgi:non-ribosomal peptide synthetase component F